VVTASAGSGKTEVVARRVERILADAMFGTVRVLALSYAVKAAEELSQRFDRRLGDAGRGVDTETLHGFAHELLRKHGTWIGLPAEPEVLTRDPWLSGWGETPRVADLLSPQGEIGTPH